MNEGPIGPKLTPGVALLPQDFPARLAALKEMTGLSWEGMAAAMGVDGRQLYRWRNGTAPNGEAMLSLVRLATQIPEGLDALLAEDLGAVRRRRS
ncbi:MAG: hypothetical protein OXT70_12935 [Chloroflexota bacterium]|nr:hypothetical protein [Chloroflexota bacterium]